MPVFYSGTILIGVRRSDCVVIGAERYSYAGDAHNPLTHDYHCKLLSFDSRHLILATAGISTYPNLHWPDKGATFEPVTSRSLLTDAIDRLSHTMHLSVDLLMNEVHNRVYPYVQHANDISVRRGEHASLTNIMIALLQEGQPTLAMLTLSDKIDIATKQELYIQPPTTLSDYYQATIISDHMFDTRNYSPRDVAAKVGQLIWGGIQHERTANGGVNLHCGGGIDVKILHKQKRRKIEDYYVNATLS
jgi:hypothetical protein